jgi:two-component system, cell cycle response regulator
MGRNKGGHTMAVSLNTMQLEQSSSHKAETATGESSQQRKQLGCDTEGTHSQGPTDPSSQPFKVLAVDDSAIYRKLVEQPLSAEGCTLSFAKNGREALDLFAKHQPDLVITDWNMPDVEGVELCKHIRRDFPDRYCYLIRLTSNNGKDKIVEGLRAGADDYLTKPFHSGELVARLEVGRRFVELHRQIQAKNRRLEEMALTDALTGLPNRRAIDVWAPRELSAAARHDFPFWAVMADLDFFKKINDIYGHDAGDTALKTFAEILTSQTRESDMCARLGGEEFLVMMTHADKEGTKTAVERIRKQFEGMKFAFGNHTMTATASFGIAGFRGTKPPDWNALVARADTALYAAKHNGRNRIEFEQVTCEVGV